MWNIIEVILINDVLVFGVMLHNSEKHLFSHTVIVCYLRHRIEMIWWQETGLTHENRCWTNRSTSIILQESTSSNNFPHGHPTTFWWPILLFFLVTVNFFCTIILVFVSIVEKASHSILLPFTFLCNFDFLMLAKFV